MFVFTSTFKFFKKCLSSITFLFHNYICTDCYICYIRIIWLSIDTVGQGKSSLSIVFNIKLFIFPLDLYYLMNKVKTGHPDSDKVQALENIT